MHMGACRALVNILAFLLLAAHYDFIVSARFDAPRAAPRNPRLGAAVVGADSPTQRSQSDAEHKGDIGDPREAAVSSSGGSCSVLGDGPGHGFCSGDDQTQPNRQISHAVDPSNRTTWREDNDV